MFLAWQLLEHWLGVFQNQAHLIVREQQVSLTISIDLIRAKVQISVKAIADGWVTIWEAWTE